MDAIFLNLTTHEDLKRIKPCLDLSPIPLFHMIYMGFGTELAMSGYPPPIEGVRLNSDVSLCLGRLSNFTKRSSFQGYRKAKKLDVDTRNMMNRPGVYILYTVISRPTITYVSTVGWKKSQHIPALTKQTKIQRLVYLGATGAISTTSTADMKVMLNLPLLQ